MFTSKNIRSIKIYALIHESNVFIGKTQGEIDPVYYRHLRAENPYTAKYFFPKNSKSPTMHILECISCSSQESYRHIVAWVRIFQDAGYEIINPRGTVEDANDLHSQTKEIVYRLQPISLETFLKETQHKKPNKCTPYPTSKSLEREQNKKSQSRQKITLWTTQEGKDCFVSYAKSLRLTQTQTLQYLMSKVPLAEADPLFPAWDNDTFIHILQELHKQEIDSRDKEIYELKAALRVYTEEKKSQAKKLNQCCHIAQKALIESYDSFDSSVALPLDIERGRYRDYISKLPEDAKYVYPSHSGESLLRLQAFLLGEGTAPARFVLGVDPQGHRIMLRYYPSIYFWGISPGNERFSQRNSVWYMAWRKTGNVAEIVAAYPMQIKAKFQNPMDEKEKLNKWVDEIVAESEAFDKKFL